jgi:hypothetical protein
MNYGRVLFRWVTREDNTHPTVFEIGSLSLDEYFNIISKTIGKKFH